MFCLGVVNEARSLLTYVGESKKNNKKKLISNARMSPFAQLTSYLISSLLVYSTLSFHRAEVGQIFALSWLITWFGHNLERFNVIVRLFDVFMANSPFMPIYVGAAVSPL